MASSAPVRESRSGAKMEHVDLTKPPSGDTPSRYDRTASEQNCSLQLIYIKLACHISQMEPAAKSCVGLYSTQLKTFLANSRDNRGLQSRCTTSALGVSVPTILLLQALFWHQGRPIENTQLGNRLPAAMASASTRTAWKDDAKAHNAGEGVIHGPGHDARIIEGNRLLHQPW
jgi:hypothetical protein